MGERITADMLGGFGDVIQFGFETIYPKGLTLEELRTSDQQWLKLIYHVFKEGSNGDDHN